MGRTEERKPLFDYFLASGFNDHHNVSQGLCGNFGIVIAEVAPAGGGYPDLCGIGGGCPLGNMNMNRFKGVVFV